MATPEDLNQPDIVRQAARLAARGATEVHRLAQPRRARQMQRVSLAVRRAMRRARRLQHPGDYRRDAD